MSAPNMEVIRSERFGQANTCSEKNALVKGKGRYIRTKQGELQMMINFDLHVPKLRSNCFFFFKEFLFFLSKDRAEPSANPGPWLVLF